MKARSIKTAVATGLLLSTLAAPAATLTLVVTGVESLEGNIMIAVFDSQEAFDEGGKPVRALRVAADAEDVTVNLDDLAAGQYAVKLYHDANGNGQMDRNAMGIPSEQYGFSGNKGRFGAPPFNKAVVEVTDDGTATTKIKLR